MTRHKKFPKHNTCCLNKKNEIIISYFMGTIWSAVCKKCGRYNYDYPENQLSVKESIEHVKNLMLYRMKGKDRILKQLKKIKQYNKIFKELIA